MSDIKVTQSDALLECDYFQLLPPKQIPRFFRQEKGVIKKRKRRCINPSFMPEIRILRRDIRRRYAEMMVNVANSHDLPLVQKFCSDMFRPDCKVIRPNPPQNQVFKVISDLLSQEGCHFHHFSGFQYLVSEYTFWSEMVPDAIFLVEESYVTVKQGFGGSVITVRFSTRGTQTAVIESQEARLTCSPIAPPIYEKSDSILTLVLDEENRVRELHIETFPVLEEPVIPSVSES